MGAPLTPSPYL